jgi:hypothetical protein
MQTLLLTILPCFLMMFQPLNAKVEKPNYDFSLDTFNDFQPQKKIGDLNSKYGPALEMNALSKMKTQKFNITHIQYKFPILVQERDGVVHDFFARLPSYFLHDLFLQSLVNRLGKQNSYKRTGEEAYYTWEVDKLRHVYSAACTITCFPIFYSVAPVETKEPTLLEQMKQGNQK